MTGQTEISKTQELEIKAQVGAAYDTWRTLKAKRRGKRPSAIPQKEFAHDGVKCSIADLEHLGDLALRMTKDEFVSFVIQKEMPSIKLTSDEMEWLKGGGGKGFWYSLGYGLGKAWGYYVAVMNNMEPGDKPA